MKTKAGKKGNRRIKEPLLRRSGRAVAAHVRIYLALLSIPVLLYGGYFAHQRLTTTPRLAIKAFKVTGVMHASGEDVIKASGLEEGTNILSFSAGEVAEEIARRVPWVRDVRVKRGVPDLVVFDVKEREPAALVKRDALHIMDSGGVVFKRLEKEDLDLPVITGLDEGVSPEDGLVSAVMVLLDTLEGRDGFDLGDVSEIRADRRYGFSVCTLKEGIRIELGFDGFEDKLQAFERVVALRGGTLKGVEAVNVMTSSEVIVKLTRAKEKEGRNG